MRAGGEWRPARPEAGLPQPSEGKAAEGAAKKMAIQTTLSFAKVPGHLHCMQKTEKLLLMLIGVLIAGMIVIIEWIV